MDNLPAHERIARRKPWLAGLLQIVTPGLGYIYSGRPKRVLVLFLLIHAIAVASIMALLWLPALLNVTIVLFVALALRIGTIADGVRCARQANPGYKLAWYNRWYIY